MEKCKNKLNKREKNKNWQKCEKVNFFVKEKLNMDTRDIWNEHAHRLLFN